MSEDGGGAKVAMFGREKCLSQEVCDEANTEVERLVGDVVRARGRAPSGKNRGNNVSDRGQKSRRHLDLAANKKRIADDIFGHPVLCR